MGKIIALLVLGVFQLSASASVVMVLEPLNITKVVQYQNLMPGPGPRDTDVTLITATYSRCGALAQEDLDIRVKKVTGEFGNQYRVTILAPGTDCSGLTTEKNLQLSLSGIPYHSLISFENPVIVIDQGQVY